MPKIIKTARFPVWGSVINANDATSYFMRYKILLLTTLLLTACTVNLEVDELPPVEVEHTLTLPETGPGAALPHTCDNLANLEMNKFIEGGVCDYLQEQTYKCCEFMYNSSCAVSFCTKTIHSEVEVKYCTIVSSGCQF